MKLCSVTRVNRINKNNIFVGAALNMYEKKSRIKVRASRLAALQVGSHSRCFKSVFRLTGLLLAEAF